MNKETFIQWLSELQTLPSASVQIWDPNTENWEKVTGAIYSENKIQLYSDLDDEENN